MSIYLHYVRVLPHMVGTVQTSICHDNKLFMDLVTFPFSCTMFKYSPIWWGLFKLAYVMIISSSWI